MKTCLATTLLLIATAASAAGETPASPALPPGHPSIGAPVNIGDVRVTKAPGPNAQTIQEVVTQRTQLKDKPVTVHGKVVKFSGGIMGKNWVHIQDGTGSKDDGSNDILVTTQDQTKPGEVITVRGTVRLDQDFGSGYAYKVLIEDGAITADKAVK
jgi:DNA/RNA endonuclease YhcR with UshA esterase domain